MIGNTALQNDLTVEERLAIQERINDINLQLDNIDKQKAELTHQQEKLDRRQQEIHNRRRTIDKNLDLLRIEVAGLRKQIEVPDRD